MCMYMSVGEAVVEQTLPLPLGPTMCASLIEPLSLLDNTVFAIQKKERKEHICCV
jgi:hypothetical protein